MSIRVLAASVAAAVALPAAPAAAVPPAPVQTGATAVCNAATGNWDVTWTLKNNVGTYAVTILQSSTSEGLATLPGLPPNGTVEVAHTFAGTHTSAQLSYIAVWPGTGMSWLANGRWTAPTDVDGTPRTCVATPAA